MGCFPLFVSFSDRHLGSNSLLLHLHFLFLSFHFFNTDLIPPPLFLTAVIPDWTGCTFLLPQRRENGRHQSVVVSLIALSRSLRMAVIWTGFCWLAPTKERGRSPFPFGPMKRRKEMLYAISERKIRCAGAASRWTTDWPARGQTVCARRVD